jgi:RNA polymerase sigma factor (sigma-70 family)
VDDELSLIERARQGDISAFGELAKRYRDVAYGAAYGVLGDFHAAEDVAQEALLRAYRHFDRFDPQRPFGAWLYTIARRLALNVAASPAPRTQALPDVPQQGGGPEGAVETAEVVRELLGGLSSTLRQTVTLYYINGYTQREVASFLGVPEGTVKRRLHDARNTLREEAVAMVEDTFQEHALDDGFVVRLLARLSDPDRRTREGAAKDARRMVLGLGFEHLKRQALSRFWYDQADAVQLLGKLGDGRASEVLTGILKEHRSERLRAEAALALGETGRPEVLPALRQAFRDPISKVRAAAYKAVRTIEARQKGGAGALPAAELSARERNVLRRALSAALEDESQSVRITAAEALALLSDRRAVRALARRFRVEAEGAVRRAIVVAGGQLGGATARGLLVSALDDADPFVVGRAAVGLGEMGAREAVPALVEAFKRWEKRAATATGSDAHMPFPVMELLGAIGELGTRAVLTQLAPYLTTSNVPSRLSLSQLFERLSDRRCRYLVPALLRAVQEPGPAFPGCYLALGKTGDLRAVPVLRERLGSSKRYPTGWQEVRKALSEGLFAVGVEGRRALLELMDSPNPAAREGAVLAPWTPKDTEALARMGCLAEEDPDASVRLRARARLHHLKERSSAR